MAPRNTTKKSSSKAAQPKTAQPKTYAVEEVVDSRVHRGRDQYLIKWADFDESHNTWEDADNIIEGQDYLLSKFTPKTVKLTRRAAKKRARKDDSDTNEDTGDEEAKTDSPAKKSRKKSPKRGRSSTTTKVKSPKGLTPTKRKASRSPRRSPKKTVARSPVKSAKKTKASVKSPKNSPKKKTRASVRKSTKKALPVGFTPRRSRRVSAMPPIPVDLDMATHNPDAALSAIAQDEAKVQKLTAQQEKQKEKAQQLEAEKAATKKRAKASKTDTAARRRSIKSSLLQEAGLKASKAPSPSTWAIDEEKYGGPDLSTQDIVMVISGNLAAQKGSLLSVKGDTAVVQFGNKTDVVDIVNLVKLPAALQRPASSSSSSSTSPVFKKPAPRTKKAKKAASGARTKKKKAKKSATKASAESEEEQESASIPVSCTVAVVWLSFVLHAVTVLRTTGVLDSLALSTGVPLIDSFLSSQPSWREIAGTAFAAYLSGTVFLHNWVERNPTPQKIALARAFSTTTFFANMVCIVVGFGSVGAWDSASAQHAVLFSSAGFLAQDLLLWLFATPGADFIRRTIQLLLASVLLCQPAVYADYTQFLFYAVCLTGAVSGVSALAVFLASGRDTQAVRCTRYSAVIAAAAALAFFGYENWTVLGENTHLKLITGLVAADIFAGSVSGAFAGNEL